MKKPTNIFDEGYVFKEPIDAFNESMRKYTDKELKKRAFKSFMNATYTAIVIAGATCAVYDKTYWAAMLILMCFINHKLGNK